jgi:uncharacterized protein (UPF0276 family)
MTWAPAIDVENASAHASKMSISFKEGILMVIAPRVRRKRQRLPPNLLIENASVRDPLPRKSLPRGVSDQG